MAYSLGNAVTNHFLIGTFELRVGPLSQAGKLTSAQSVGLVEAFNLNSQINTTTLSASYPRRVVDSAVTSSLSSFGITLREYSARNLRMLMGEGVSAYTDSDKSFIANASVSSSVSVGNSNISFSTLEPPVAVPLSISVSAEAEAATDGPNIAATTNTFTVTNTTKNPNVNVSSADFLGNNTHVLTLTIPKMSSKAFGFNVTYDTEKFTFLTVTGASSFSSNPSASVISFSLLKGSGNATVKVYLKAKVSDTGSFTVLPPLGYLGAVVVAFSRESATLLVGDTVSLVNAADPANPIITEVVSFNSSSATSPGLTVKNTGRAIPSGTHYTIRKCETVGAGNMDTNNRFFTASLIHLDRAGKIPLIYEFWKCSLESGMDLSVDVTQFSSTQLQVKVLKPTLTDTLSGGVLSHMAAEIAQSPTWRYSSLPVGL
jgi:hypothetical protein